MVLVKISLMDIFKYIGVRNWPMVEGEQGFKAGHVILCQFKNVVKIEKFRLALQTSALTSNPHEVNICLTNTMDKWICLFSCKAGQSAFCNHVDAVLIYTIILTGYGRNQRNLCGSFYPKPMVTPVHRFQSIESVTNNGIRYNRSPGYHARLPAPSPASSIHYNGSSSNIRIPQVGRSLEMIAPGHTATVRNNVSPTSKLKCGAWIFFAIVTFFLAGAKYYFHGINIGVEVLGVCSLIVVMLIIGGVITLCEAVVSYSPANTNIEAPVIQVSERQQENEDIHHQQVTTSQNPAEMPPPPYHIAVMLSPQNNLDSIQVIRDSPPPSYEKAVT